MTLYMKNLFSLSFCGIKLAKIVIGCGLGTFEFGHTKSLIGDQSHYRSSICLEITLNQFQVGHLPILCL